MNTSERVTLSFQFASDTTKQLITLATAIIGLEITFLKEIATITENILSLQISWVCFLISIILGLWTMMALTGSLGSISSDASSGTSEPSIYSRNIKWPAIFQILLFVTGLLLTMIAGCQAKPEGPISKITTQALEYREGESVFKGYLAYDDTVKGKRPGVLVVHEFWGLNEFAKERADKLARMGYVALAVDMYGGGKVTQDREEASKLASHVRSTPLMRERARAGLEVLQKHNLVNPQKLAAIGFCFGGTTVLELAYSGADLRGVASFHGGLTAPKPEDLKNLKASILVLHGAEDPHIKPEEIKAFQDGMRQAGADWQMVYYGGAVHSFANPEAGSDKSKGVAYDPKAAARSWQLMGLFLQELFSK